MKIGSNLTIQNNVVLAPLCGVTDFPFRRIARELGAQLTFTEMVSAKGLVYASQKTFQLLAGLEQQQPIAAQIFGAEPEIMAEAAAICQEMGATILDINMGCPQKKVVKTGAGAALMLEPELAAKIVKEVSKQVSIPVSCKIRSGWDSQTLNAPSFAKKMEEAGASLITVHARTKKQMFSGRAKWEIIKEVKECVNIPVIANGDITSCSEAKKCMELTGADGVMVGRASIGRPWLIGAMYQGLLNEREIVEPDIKTKLEIMQLHLKFIEEFYLEPVAVKVAKQHLAWHTKGMRNSASFRNRLHNENSLAGIKRLLESISEQQQ